MDDVKYLPNTVSFLFSFFLHEESAQHERYMVDQRAFSFHSNMVEME